MMGVGDYKCLSLVNRWHEGNEQEGPAEVIFLVTACDCTKTLEEFSE